ncbi:MAG TPA: glutamate racemase [Anaerolineales bacterium]|nr:glutamate racemase [Anaerolineales bacterium]
MLSTSQPIGLFDSGVGGLSVLREIRKQLPHENLLYFADQAHVPYGARSLEEVRDLCETITRWLLGQGAKMIVIPCNTASAAALRYLRQKFPNVPFVGMEPAVKPAAEQTQTGAVGVLATPVTFQGELYASVVERFAQGVKVLQHTCPGLVNEIEQGAVHGNGARHILEDALHPMLDQGIDTVVLGCTHYPFVIPLIQEIAGPDVRVIDPSPAVARQVGRLLPSPALRRGRGSEADPRGEVRFVTTGEAEQLRAGLKNLLGIEAPVESRPWNIIEKEAATYEQRSIQ